MYSLDTINSNGCDSTVSLDLTIYEPTDSSFNFILCPENDEVTIGGNTYSTEGNFVDTILSIGGCDSILNINIVFSSVEELTIDGSTSVSVEDISTYSVVNSEGSDYNWSVSSGATIVSGQGTNEVSIEFTSSGESVISVYETNLDECMGLVASLNISVQELVNINDFSSNKIFSVFPNPFSDEALLIFSNPNSESFSLEIIDLQGRLVRSYESITNDRLIIKKEDLSEGLYYLYMNGPNGFVNKSSMFIK